MAAGQRADENKEEEVRAENAEVDQGQEGGLRVELVRQGRERVDQADAQIDGPLAYGCCVESRERH